MQYVVAIPAAERVRTGVAGDGVVQLVAVAGLGALDQDQVLDVVGQYEVGLVAPFDRIGALAFVLVDPILVGVVDEVVVAGAAVHVVAAKATIDPVVAGVSD